MICFDLKHQAAEKPLDSGCLLMLLAGGHGALPRPPLSVPTAAWGARVSGFWVFVCRGQAQEWDGAGDRALS